MFLIDTNVLSEFRKAGTDRMDLAVKAWFDEVPEEQTFISVISIMELERWVLLKARHDPAQAGIIRRWLQSRILPRYARRLLSVDRAVAQKTAALHVPDPRPHPDALIAGTALVHGLTVVTRNTRDFAPLGVPVIDPWSGAG